MIHLSTIHIEFEDVESFIWLSGLAKASFKPCKFTSFCPHNRSFGVMFQMIGFKYGRDQIRDSINCKAHCRLGLHASDEWPVSTCK